MATTEGAKTLERRSDQELVDLALQGLNEAFDALVLRHRRRVTGMALRYFPNFADAEELAQDAFVRAYLNLKKLKSGVPFEYWLLRITVNICLDRLRGERRRKEESWSQLSAEENSRQSHKMQSATLNKPDNFQLRFDAKDLLDRILPRIGPKDRAVIHLLYSEGRSVAEVSEILGWTKSNVKVRALRIRQILRKTLKQLDAIQKG